MDAQRQDGFIIPRVIGYDGQQHYEASHFFGGAKQYASTKRRDRIKTAYARKKKIRLIRVRYSVRDVEAFLVKRLRLGSNQ